MRFSPRDSCTPVTGCGSWTTTGGVDSAKQPTRLARAGCLVTCSTAGSTWRPAPAGIWPGFRLLRVPCSRPTPMASTQQSLDCLLVYRVRHVTMGSASSKLWRAVVSQALGPAAARQMTSGWPGSQLACVPPAARCEGAVPSWVGLDDGGSNNWALAGSRTDSGLPLLAGDPHRPLEAPNVYAQGHVSCPDWDVLGLAIPGVPGFPHFGHNTRLAWCITHAMADDQDLYQCTADELRSELIEVRGADPVRIDVGSSGRGPMICE